MSDPAPVFDEDDHDKPEECEGCEYPTEALTFFPNPGYGLQRPVWLCEICAGSRSGRSVQFDTELYRVNHMILGQIAYVGNVILAEIRKRS